jgi:hypothetical protein
MANVQPLAPTKEPAALWHAIETLPDDSKAFLALTLLALLLEKDESYRRNQIVNLLIGQLDNVLAEKEK